MYIHAPAMWRWSTLIMRVHAIARVHANVYTMVCVCTHVCIYIYIHMYANMHQPFGARALQYCLREHSTAPQPSRNSRMSAS